MKTKKIISAFQVSIIILIITIFIICLIGFFNTEPLQFRMFSDIDDFAKLDQYVTKEMFAEDDKNIKDLIPTESYVKEISYEGHTYSVYAYVFDESEDASSYFENATGKAQTQSGMNYSMTTNYLFSSRYIVLYDCSVYCVEGGSYQNFVKAINFINEHFPINVE